MPIHIRMLLTASLLALSLYAMPVHAAKEPKPLITDGRMKQIMYDPMQVYKITANYYNQTTVAFAENEVIELVAVGDSIAWQVVDQGNHLYIKPVESNAGGNLTVRTNKRNYFFELTSSKSTKDQTYLVQFRYPDDAPALASAGTAKPANFTSGDFDPAGLNLDYGISGNEAAFGLKRVFDDGQFTYFLFAEGADIPSFYRVLPDGTEAIVNTRREGNYMVVESVNNGFTLRNGNTHLCVRNNTKAAWWWSAGTAPEDKKGGVKR